MKGLIFWTMDKDMKVEIIVEVELNPDLCDWPDATLSPLSWSNQLDSRPLWVRNIPDGENDVNGNIWNDSFFLLL